LETLQSKIFLHGISSRTFGETTPDGEIRIGPSLLEPALKRGVESRREREAETQIRSAAMGLFTKDIKTMDDLFLHVVQDIYYAEQQIMKSLPDMIAKATNRELTTALRNHLGETEKQIGRLDKVFELLGQKPKGAHCPAIDGIIKEANEIAAEVSDKKVLDAALIAAAQAVEHYEITRYGTLIAWAEELGNDAVAKLLNTTLNEEKAADKKLSTIAEKKVNLNAAG
jgi:ferritin-like metal-binding protein YciE